MVAKKMYKIASDRKSKREIKYLKMKEITFTYRFLSFVSVCSVLGRLTCKMDKKEKINLYLNCFTKTKKKQKKIVYIWFLNINF